MLCNISQNAMGQPGGGTLPGPARGGTLARGRGTLAGGTLVGGYPGWGVPCQVQPGGTLVRGYPGWGVPWLGGVPCLGGYPGQGGTLPGGYLVRTT